MVGYTHNSMTLWTIWDPNLWFEHSQKSSLMNSGMHTFHAPEKELIFLDKHKMQNTLRNFIPEMDFSNHRTLQLDRVEIDFSRAVPMISVQQVSIAICPTTIHSFKLSLHVQAQDHILLMRGIQSFFRAVVIIARIHHRHRDSKIRTANVSATRITLPAGKPQP